MKLFIKNLIADLDHSYGSSAFCELRDDDA